MAHSVKCTSVSVIAPVILVALACLCTFPRASLAQMPSATILGVVTDSSSAVIPGATVSVRNLETGQSRSITTDTNGRYRLAQLPVGLYEVRTEQAGFRSEVRTGVALSVAQEAVLDFTLGVGGIEQTVTVSAEAPLVNTTSGALGGLVDEKKGSRASLERPQLHQPNASPARRKRTSLQVAGQRDHRHLV